MRIRTVGMGVLLALMAMGTHARVRVWSSELAVWTEAARVSPHKPRPFVNLGREYALIGDAERARRAYTHAERLADAPGRSWIERDATHAVVARNLTLLEQPWPASF